MIILSVPTLLRFGVQMRDEKVGGSKRKPFFFLTVEIPAPWVIEQWYLLINKSPSSDRISLRGSVLVSAKKVGQSSIPSDASSARFFWALGCGSRTFVVTCAVEKEGIWME